MSQFCLRYNACPSFVTSFVFFVFQAQLDDGYFKLLLVSSLKRHDVVCYLPGLLLGKLPQRDPRIQYRVAKGLKLISSSPLNVHLDGEIYGTGTIPADCEVTIDHARQIEVELLTADG
jgi:diacylglycerol kinase family enzyme